MDKIPQILEDLTKALSDLEAVMENSSVKDNPAVQAARKKLIDTIRREVNATADLAISSKLAYPLLKQLQSALPVSLPFAKEDDEKKS
jgi:hypothetical protein